MGAIRNRVFKTIRENKKNIENGVMNCIPWPIPSMRSTIPGIRQGKYYMITAQQKVGKTQLSCFVLFEAILYAYKHKSDIHLKIFCFPLEETPELIMERFISYVLHKADSNVRLTATDMESISKGLSDDYLNLITKDPELIKLLDFFESVITFSEERTPTGIWKVCSRYADETGDIEYEEYPKPDGTVGKRRVGYTQRDKKEYRIIWVDHLGLLGTDNSAPTIREAIQQMSSLYFVKLRNIYNFTILAVQQQMAYDTIDAFKLDKIEPSATNLSDNKATAKDVNTMIGLWSPYMLGKDTIADCPISFRRLTHFGRILKVCVNRDGICGDSYPLFMDGAVSSFEPMTAETINEQYTRAAILSK